MSKIPHFNPTSFTLYNERFRHLESHMLFESQQNKYMKCFSYRLLIKLKIAKIFSVVSVCMGVVLCLFIFNAVVDK